ncbi:MAG: apolipoprotein N-acyltransferase [Enterobacterales bacterium]|nr:apolipoprotein N-acyltransferase [Enterobacterales bacterium]
MTPSARQVATLQMLLLGGLYPFGFAPFNFWPLSLLSLMALVYGLIKQLEAGPTPSEDKTTSLGSGWRALLRFSTPTQQTSLFKIVFSWSIGAFAVGVSWVYVSIHNYGHANVLLALLITALFVLLLASVKAACFYLLQGLVSWFGKGRVLLIIPFVWIISELVQSKLFSGFPWLFAGYTQLDGPLSVVSTWIGVYGVGWSLLVIACLFVILGIQFFQVKSEAYWRSLILPVALISLIMPVTAWLLPLQQHQVDSKALKIALVQPNISQNDKWDRAHFSRIMDILYAQSQHHWKADLLVWPEGAIPAYRHQVKDIIVDLKQRARANQSHILLGLPVYDFATKTSYSAMIGLGGQTQEYHKQVLVPFGEYVPLGGLLRGVIEFFNLPMSSFSPATSPQKAIEFEGFTVIPAICYEITYPKIVQNLVHQADELSDKPKLIVTISNDAWFGSSFGPDQHLQMARMRALELGLPLVRATNDGISAVVDAKGKLLQRLPKNQQATLEYTLALDYYQTPYRRYGLWGIAFILLASICFLLLHRLALGREQV